MIIKLVAESPKKLQANNNYRVPSQGVEMEQVPPISLEIPQMSRLDGNRFFHNRICDPISIGLALISSTEIKFVHTMHDRRGGSFPLSSFIDQEINMRTPSR